MSPAVPLLIFSPHLDDAVFSCTGLVLDNPGSVVATVFAGWPVHTDAPGRWDSACGFSSAHKATETRRKEDRRALTLLGAGWDHGALLDSQYGPPVPERPSLIRRYVEQQVARYQPAKVLIPLGLKHPDHIELRNQALEVCRESRGGPEWLAYTDLPYGEEWPSLIETARNSIESGGFRRLRFVKSPAVDVERKLQAVECYASQTVILFASSVSGDAVSVRDLLRRLRWLRRILRRDAVFRHSQLRSETYSELRLRRSRSELGGC